MERSYRSWCLSNRLFLNDLNDIYQEDPLAAADVLTLPSLTTPVSAPQPHALGFFNQLKQEYTSARFSFYDGLTRDRLHYADKNVTLIDTLDYPAYGHATEQIKIAFRVSYSLLDKTAYFLNDYLDLRIPERRVSFRGIWYNNQEPDLGLRLDTFGKGNTALKGLFWLGKDLFDRAPEFVEVLEPEARDLAQLRNHLEHKYVKLHLFGPPPPDEVTGRLDDELALSLDRQEFEQRTLRLLQLARSALLYLSMAVYLEEGRRQREGGNITVRMDVPVFTFPDRFKV